MLYEIETQNVSLRSTLIFPVLIAFERIFLAMVPRIAHFFAHVIFYSIPS